MLRFIWLSILMALPFIVYAIYLKFTKEKKWKEAPFAALIIISVILTFLGLLFLRFGEHDNSNKIYIPDRYENGVFIKGHFEDKE